MLNLARTIWVKKSWTLKELHVQFLNIYKNLIFRAYKDIQNNGSTERCRADLTYSHPVSGERLTYDMV